MYLLKKRENKFLQLSKRIITPRAKVILYFVYFELKKLYARNNLGLIWLFLAPLLQAAIYIFVFSFILNVRYEVSPGQIGGPLYYAVSMFMGLIPWLLLNIVLNEGAGMVSSYIGFIRQPNFPYQIIPSVIFLKALPGHLTGMVVLLICMSCTVGLGGLNPFLILCVYILMFWFVRGLASAIGILALAISDIPHIVQLVINMVIYLTPVFYRPSAVPKAIKFIIYLNPFSYYISSFKMALSSDASYAVITPYWDFLIFSLIALIFYRLQKILLKNIRATGVDRVA